MKYVEIILSIIATMTKIKEKKNAWFIFE